MKEKLFAIVLLVLMCGFSINAQQNVSLNTNTTVVASSTYNSTINNNFSPYSTIDGDSTSINWGNYGGWNDGTRDVFPDTLTTNFSSPRFYGLKHIIVFTVPDSIFQSTEPSITQTCTLYGIKDFNVDVQDVNGNWINMATITGNTLCRRDIIFNSIPSIGYRIIVNASWDGHFSRIIEHKAFAE